MESWEASREEMLEILRARVKRVYGISLDEYIAGRKAGTLPCVPGGAGLRVFAGDFRGGEKGDAVSDVTKYRAIDFDFVEPTGGKQVSQDLGRLKLAMKHLEAELYAAKTERHHRDPDPSFMKWRNGKTEELNAIRRRYNALKQWQRDHAVPIDDGRRDIRTDLTSVLTGDLVYELKLRVQSLEAIAEQAIGYRDAYVRWHSAVDVRILPADEDEEQQHRCLEALRRAVAIYEGLENTEEHRREAVL